MKTAISWIVTKGPALLAETTQALSGGEPSGSDAASRPAPNFQPYIFWAFGLCCVLIGLFVAWTFWQGRRLDERIDHLEERFRRAHPGETAGHGEAP